MILINSFGLLVAIGSGQMQAQDSLKCIAASLRVTETRAITPATEILQDWAKRAGIKIVFPPNFAERKLDVFVRDVPLRNAMDSVAEALEMVWEPVEGGLRLVETKATRERRDAETKKFHEQNVNRIASFCSALIQGSRTRLSAIESRLEGVQNEFGPADFYFDEKEPRTLGNLTAEETLVARPWMWASGAILAAYGPSAASDLYAGKLICDRRFWPAASSPIWVEELLARSQNYEPSQEAQLIYGIHLAGDKVTFQSLTVCRGSLEGMQSHAIRLARFQTALTPEVIDLTNPSKVLKGAGDEIIDPTKFRPLGLWSSGAPLAEHWNGFHTQAGINLVSESFTFKSGVPINVARKCADIARDIVARRGGHFRSKHGIVRYVHELPQVLESFEPPYSLYQKWSNPEYGNSREAIEDVANLPFRKRTALPQVAFSTQFQDRWRHVVELGTLLASLPKQVRANLFDGKPSYEAEWPESSRTELRVRTIGRAILSDVLEIATFTDIIAGTKSAPFSAFFSTSVETTDQLSESLSDNAPFREFRTKKCRTENGFLYLGFNADRSIKVPFQLISFIRQSDSRSITRSIDG